VAVNPPLGVYNIGDTGAGAADGEFKTSAAKLATCKILF
jgi:hypothetical protein